MEKNFVATISDLIKRDKFDLINQIFSNILPTGSGFDAGCFIDERSEAEKIIIKCHYHKMNDAGYYDGWILSNVVLTPTFSSDYNIEISFDEKIWDYDEMDLEYIVDTMVYAIDDCKFQYEFDHDKKGFNIKNCKNAIYTPNYFMEV